MKKRHVLFLAAVLFVAVGNVSAATGARHYSDASGNVFLGGNYIEIGVSKYGVFGTTSAPKDEWGFHFINGKESNSAYLGLLADGDGWDNGETPVAGDFFTPGTPEERWMFAYKIDGTTYVYTGGRTSVSGNWITRPTAVDASTGKILQADLVGETVHNVKIKISYIFNEEDFEYETKVEVENNGEKDITDVRFLRSFDPDQDQWFNGTYNTYNKVTSNPSLLVDGSPTNFAMVVARGVKTGAGVFFLSFDNRARASLLGGLNPNSIYDTNLWENAPVTSKTYTDDADVRLDINDTSNLNGYINVDAGIAITTNLGTLTKNQKDSTSFITSLDPNVEESLDKLSKVEATVDINSIVVDADSEQYYALFDEDGKIVKTWTNKADKNGKIVFDGLEANKKYVVKTVSKDDFDKTSNKPKTEAIVESHEIKTQIDPMKPVNNSDKAPSSKTDLNTIIIENLNDEFEYQLLDEDGEVVVDFKNPTDGKIVFSDLKENTKYYFVGKTTDGELTGKVLIITSIEESPKTDEPNSKTDEISSKTDDLNPKTYDSIYNYVALLIASLVSIIGLVVYKKKR